MEIILATNNAHKTAEFKRMLEPMGHTVLSQKECGISVEVEETGTTFAENAFLKADAIHRLTGSAVIADDSGLCVDALAGAPGVYSARYGGEGLDDHGRNLLLLKNMEGVSDRTARFVCAIVYIDPHGISHCFEGSCEGIIGFAEQGAHGFGYDPLFLVEGGSFAELSGEEKDAVSHRGKANRMFCEYLMQQKQG